MKNIKTTDIGKKLEELRNKFIQNLNKGDLCSEVMTSQLNVFFTIYVLTITDEETASVTSIKDIYRDFYSIKFSASRFLIELFLSSLEISSQENYAKRFDVIFSHSISEKINTHAINKKLLEKNGPQTDFVSAVEKGRKEYAAFIEKYGKCAETVPDDIEDYFPNNGSEIYKSGLADVRKFKDKFGFSYLKHPKFKFSNIIDENQRLTSLCESLQKKKVFNAITDKALLRFMYHIYSAEQHPSLSAVATFEKFIASNQEEKKMRILNRKQQNDVFIKMVGALMVELYEEITVEQFGI